MNFLLVLAFCKTHLNLTERIARRMGHMVNMLHPWLEALWDPTKTSSLLSINVFLEGWPEHPGTCFLDTMQKHISYRI